VSSTAAIQTALAQVATIGEHLTNGAAGSSFHHEVRMTLQTDKPSTPSTAASNSKRNFILQQGLCDPAADSCSLQYSALLFQPRLIALWVVAATVVQSPIAFFVLAAVLWFNALLPRLNPFDVLYNAILSRSRGTILNPAPAPRRFAQFLAGSFALAIALSLTFHWRATAIFLESFFIGAIAALVLAGFCFGSFVFHVICGRAKFAKRTLPWSARD
jgi:hypothetical protein